MSGYNRDSDEATGKPLPVYEKPSDETIQRLRGQLQNCVNHLERAKRHWPRGDFDQAIESANRALYETLND